MDFMVLFSELVFIDIVTLLTEICPCIISKRYSGPIGAKSIPNNLVLWPCQSVNSI